MSYIFDVIYLDIFIYIYFYDCSNYFISVQFFWASLNLCLLALLCCMWSFWDTAQSLGFTASGALVSANLKDNTSRELLQPGPYSLHYHIFPSCHVTQTAVLNLPLAFLHSCKWALLPLSHPWVGLWTRVHVTEEWTAPIPLPNSPRCFFATQRLTAEVHTMPRCVRPAEQSCTVSRQPPA